ncbi:hypothetical protein [Desulfurobacterium crinifex]
MNLRKELATKEDILLAKEELYSEIHKLYGEIHVNQKIETVREELKGEIKVLKVMIYALYGFVILFTKGTIEFIFQSAGNFEVMGDEGREM